MRYALVDKEKQEARPKLRGTCPGCGGETIAKCGAIKIWHWAHIGEDCDPWHEPESAWHLGWKKEAPSARCEVVMPPHRADIVGRDGLVVELQHSSIAVQDIYDREDFYKRMVWLIDAMPFAKNVSFRPKEDYTTFRWKHPRTHHGSFNAPVFWDVEEYARQAIVKAKQRMIDHRAWLEKLVPLDRIEQSLKYDLLFINAQDDIAKYTEILAHPIFHIRRISIHPPCGGWGIWFTRQEFIANYIAPGNLL